MYRALIALVALAGIALSNGTAMATETEAELLAKLAAAQSEIKKAEVKLIDLDALIVENRHDIKAIERTFDEGGDPDRLLEKLKLAERQLEALGSELKRLVVAVAEQELIVEKVEIKAEEIDSAAVDAEVAESFTQLAKAAGAMTMSEADIASNQKKIDRLGEEIGG
jgi:chromosome segregation ATPase